MGIGNVYHDLEKVFDLTGYPRHTINMGKLESMFEYLALQDTQEVPDINDARLPTLAKMTQLSSYNPDKILFESIYHGLSLDTGNQFFNTLTAKFYSIMGQSFAWLTKWL